VIEMEKSIILEISILDAPYRGLKIETPRSIRKK